MTTLPTSPWSSSLVRRYWLRATPSAFSFQL
eukprot:CAMPEP_0117649854 /NCGR_PEP_ID=MMETSP0804-20121206/1217_1 /TAXON_ID=1074897 /ORGANISM="Tetraselmis astigmatica, Strain CCMP880" /LENGTH=30 /DNA_ID= /DNA_START= /DNA_END= /DNA_ORIENTATION=